MYSWQIIFIAVTKRAIKVQIVRFLDSSNYSIISHCYFTEIYEESQSVAKVNSATNARICTNEKITIAVRCARASIPNSHFSILKSAFCHLLSSFQFLHLLINQTALKSFSQQIITKLFSFFKCIPFRQAFPMAVGKHIKCFGVFFRGNFF